VCVFMCVLMCVLLYANVNADVVFGWLPAAGV